MFAKERVVARLVDKVERHLAASGTPPTTFGRQAANDPRLVFDLRHGRRPRAAIRARILQLIEGEDERCDG